LLLHIKYTFLEFSIDDGLPYELSVQLEVEFDVEGGSFGANGAVERVVDDIGG